MVPGITKHHKAQVPTFERQNMFHPNFLVYWVQGWATASYILESQFSNPSKNGLITWVIFTPWKHQGSVTVDVAEETPAGHGLNMTSPFD